MKKTPLGIMLIVSILFALTATAQRNGKKFSFGFGLEAGIPVGDEDLKEYYGIGAGLSLRASFKAGPGYVTLGSGFVAFIPKEIDEDDLDAAYQIPIKAGYKFIFLKHLFVHGEMGYSRFNYVYVDDDDQVQSEGYGGLTFAPSFGGNFGAFELGLKYESIVGLKLGGPKKSSLSTLGVRLAFNF